MLYLWWRMEEERLGLWRLYGWFCGLMVCGSCFGVVTWAARMMNLVTVYESNDASVFAQQLSLVAISYRWGAVFVLSYAIEFMCLSAAKLMVLDRMSVFAAGRDSGKRWVVGGRMVMAVVVLGNAVGLAANVASAVHVLRAAEAASTASVLYAANSSQVADEYNSLSKERAQLAGSISAVQSFCEVAVLLLIVVAFIVAGVFCARVVSFRLLAVDAASAPAAVGRVLRRQVIVTTVFVFVAFVIRSSFSIMRAVAAQLQDRGKRCPGVTSFCDASCYNMFTHMQRWMGYTPEFQVTIVLVSSPLALLVALWGMTSRQMLQAMKSRKRRVAMTHQALLFSQRRV
jgi:hypothetical protein